MYVLLFSAFAKYKHWNMLFWNSSPFALSVCVCASHNFLKIYMEKMWLVFYLSLLWGCMSCYIETYVVYGLDVITTEYKISFQDLYLVEFFFGGVFQNLFFFWQKLALCEIIVHLRNWLFGLSKYGG